MQKKSINLKLNMIVCVAENNLIGDRNPVGNGLLWHSKEDLNFFKEKTIGNILVFGKTTGEVVPVNLLRKTREVEILKEKGDFEKVLEKYKNSDKEIFICGGASIYKYFIENYNLDKIYVSKLKPVIKVAHATTPLYFPNVEEYGYEISKKNEYKEFISYVYTKRGKK